MVTGWELCNPHASGQSEATCLWRGRHWIGMNVFVERRGKKHCHVFQYRLRAQTWRCDHWIRCNMQHDAKIDLPLICKLDRENVQSRPPSKTNYIRENRKLFWQNWLYPLTVFDAAFVRFPTLWTSSFEFRPVKACWTPIPDLLP